MDAWVRACARVRARARETAREREADWYPGGVRGARVHEEGRDTRTRGLYERREGDAFEEKVGPPFAPPPAMPAWKDGHDYSTSGGPPLSFLSVPFVRYIPGYIRLLLLPPPRALPRLTK